MHALLRLLPSRTRTVPYRSFCRCSCFDGYGGPDCSQRECPKGRAWADIAVDVDVAHQPAECSNAGICDTMTGLCMCDWGTTGKACDRKTCPNDCNLNGVCVSMHHHAQAQDPGDGGGFKYTTNWDHDMLSGCVCDPGFYGPECLLKSCQHGDDPLTTGQFNEMQTISCTATAGSFTLRFRGRQTRPLAHDSTATDIRLALEGLGGGETNYLMYGVGDGGSPSVTTSIGDSSVGGGVIYRANVVILAGGTTACSAGGSSFVVEFLQDFGDLPSIVADASDLTCAGNAYGGAPVYCDPSMAVAETRKGTKENLECSGRGLCDPLLGVCLCTFTGALVTYGPSDGAGNEGTRETGNDGRNLNRGDCGSATSTILTCPGEIPCAGHGVCQGSPTYVCDCASGWRGTDCSERLCTKGTAWFDLPSADDEAHAAVECSNMGVCDRNKGTCTCTTGFEGGSCQYRICPGTPRCSGHGQCMSMAQLAERRTDNGDPAPTSYGLTPNDPRTWDTGSQGCFCDRGFTGHDCSRRVCPHGDDPMVPRGTNTKQQLICLGTTGWFALKFRGFMTANIPFDSPSTVVQAELMKLPTVGRVTVKYTANGGGAPIDPRACTPLGVNEMVITFLEEFGHLPPLTAHKDIGRFTQTNTRLIINVDGAGMSVMGTKQNIECNGRGLCDWETGLCACFAGYGSSDGTGAAGARGDCGHVEAFAGKEATDQLMAVELA